MGRVGFLFVFLSAFLWCAGFAAAEDKPAGDITAPYVHIVQVKGGISASTYYMIKNHIQKAQERNAAAIVLAIDTPGGIYSSTKQINKAILDSPIPVVTYVSPAGAHAASAGTYILYASHVAAMSPGTNIGAATPIKMSGNPVFPGSEEFFKGIPNLPNPNAISETLERKMVNDAAAYMRSLAELRERNVIWAEEAVRDAATLTASEALKENVIEFIAEDIPRLLDQVDGMTVKMAYGKKHVLKTKGAITEIFEPDWRASLLSVITHPNVVFLLLALGGYGLIYEVSNPGAMFPGVVGAVCLLLALFAMNILPMNQTGILLLLLGVGLMAAEAFVPSFGILGVGGAAAFGFGATMMFDTTMPGYGVDLWVIAMVTLTSLSFFMVLLTLALKAQRRQVITGQAGLLSSVAEVVSWQGGHGNVYVTGEIWQAVSDTAYIIKKGDKVKITEMNGMVLTVHPDKNLNS